MNPQKIIEDLQNSGIMFTVVGDKLRLKADAEIPPAAIETVREHKAEILSILKTKKKPTRAKGFGCAGCGNKIYEAVEVWETREILEPSEFKHEHIQVTHWQCEGCGAVFEIIGGSKGPQFLN
jgi:hypothetical protein